MYRITILILLIPFCCFGQNYTSYITGNSTDIVTSPSGGVCLMGGATEDDYAMKWFLQRANGGDVLVLRTTGTNGYNNYLYSSLGITVNSVETIVCNNAAASSDPYVLQKIQQAEAIWFTGGDQWTYINYWRNTPIDSLINQGIQQRKLVVGGTSAGMAIQGKYYFSAQNGSVTSAVALSNPFNNLVTVDSSSFIKNSRLTNVITDTHFDNPDRKGRLVTFLSRIFNDYGVFGKAIACDEYTSVCIDTNGIARVFGGFPTYDDNAYFVQSNCELANQNPENCTSANPLTWDLGGLALKVYQIKGDSSGSKIFDLNNWQSGTGGIWNNWSVANGNFTEQIGNSLNCTSTNVNEILADPKLILYPNPTTNNLFVTASNDDISNFQISIYNSLGKMEIINKTIISSNNILIDFSTYKSGVYHIVAFNSKSGFLNKTIIKL